jgi:hypothetical protein
MERVPVAQARGAVFPSETTGGADITSSGIVVLDWVDALPSEVLEDIFQKGLQWDEIHGILHKGQIYLIRQNLKSEADIEEVLLHELAGHGGARALFGKNGMKSFVPRIV